jgi:hypothetical protein
MRSGSWLLILSVALAVSAGASTGVPSASARSTACPAPNPLPASAKKPPRGASAVQLANFLLALPQRKPCDVNLFTSRFEPGPYPAMYPEGSPMKPAEAVPGTVRDEATVRAALASFLDVQLAGDATRINAALAIFDGAATKARLPDPTLRAALVSLHGTLAEPVIQSFVSGIPSLLETRFGGTPLGVVATAFGIAGNKRILLSRAYSNENFTLLSATFAHEILHIHEGPITATEEILAHATTAAIHLQLLARHPQLATGGTQLARQMNDEVMLFLNSRAPGSPKIALIAPEGKGTAPGSLRSQRDLYGHGKQWNLFRQQPPAAGDNTPAPPIFGKLLRTLLARGVAVPKPLTYSRRTVERFSRLNDTWASPVDRLRVSVLLGLVSMEEIVKYTGVPRSKAISLFRLEPILAVMR